MTLGLCAQFSGGRDHGNGRDTGLTQHILDLLGFSRLFDFSEDSRLRFRTAESVSLCTRLNYTNICFVRRLRVCRVSVQGKR
jgi:hypothetical protein